MSARPTLTGAAVFVFSFLLLLPGLGLRPLTSRAEARIPLVGLDIVRTGRLFPPHLLGEPYLNKPPLHHLLCAGAISLFGSHDEAIVRLPSVLCGALAVWLTWLLASRLAGPRLGIVAAAFLLLSYRFFSLARSTELEILLTAAMALAYLGLWSAIQKPARRPGAPAVFAGWWIASAGVAIGCLAKGPVIALLFPAVLLVADAIVSRTWRRVVSPGFLILLLGAVIGTGAYYGPLIVKFGGVRELVDRLAFENVLHAHGFHYYLWQLPLGLLPAGIALPWMLVALKRPHPIPRTCALAMGIGIVVFSLSPSKQSHYLLPLYPLVAVWAASSGVFSKLRGAVILVLVVLGAAGMILVEIANHIHADVPDTVAGSMRDYAAAVQAKPVAMMERHPVLAYYLDRPDLEFRPAPAAARQFIEDRRGFVVVDLEKREALPADLVTFEVARRVVEGHTYLLLGPPEKPASGR